MLNKILATLILLLVAGAALNGQTVASAYGPPQSLLVGVEYANMMAGFPNGSATRLAGVGVMAGYHFNNRFGVEGRWRMLNLGGWYGQSQREFLGGPRYTIINHGKWRPFASFQVGVVHIHYPFTLGDGDQLAYVPGGGLDYRLNRRWFLRAAYEYQILPGSPNFTNATQYGMKPNGFQTGLLFRIK